MAHHLPQREAWPGRPGPGADWLPALVAAARARGVELAGPVAQDGVLTVEVRVAGAAPLRVDVLPAAGRGPCYLVAGRCGLRHHGRAPPDPAQAAGLRGLAGALEEVQARLPGRPEAAAPGAAPVVTVERSVHAATGEVWTELLVRLTARCNQACGFCSAPPPHPDADAAALGTWLEDALVHHPNPCVTLTGGEPTLWPGLPGLVARLLASPAVRVVLIQTNGVGLADAGRLAAFRPHERLAFFVSLHGATPALYDACTGSVGQLSAARRGVAGLLAAGHPTTLNLVVTRLNLDHLPAWVEAVGAWFGQDPRLRIHFSVLTFPEHRPGAAGLMVRYREAVPALLEAVRRARAAGLACDALLDASHAAVPPCLLPAHERGRAGRGGHAARPLRVDVDGAPRGSSPGWSKAPSCGRCSEDAWCQGLPGPYVERFGLEELSPIVAEGTPR